MVYLFFQTWVWLLGAALLGLFIGWLIWRNGASADCSGIQRELDECKRRCADLESKANAVASESANVNSDSNSGDGNVSTAQSFVSSSPEADVEVKAESPKDGDKPVFLSAPDGEPDDLKRISGVGKVLEGTLNTLGIYHFRQIAEFTRENIDWVDNYLSFTGRIDREDWVGQAKKLAAGEDTDFANRYDKK